MGFLRKKVATIFLKKVSFLVEFQPLIYFVAPSKLSARFEITITYYP
jgi:hypothetical protein